ncbi:MAG: PASTA domain-containing protein [Acidobacteria bacterium]|nr:PASTA domain-containing protein [Acidobacteriota bacterium]
MNTATGVLSALRRIGIVVAIAILFVFGLATTVYLSLRSPEVTVPDVLGKDRFEAERVLGDAGLKFRVRATRPSSQMKADTVLFQLPRGGEVVKAGQTVAMDISRTVKEGESSEVVVPEKTPEEKPSNQNANEAISANENKPKRNKNTNRNANDNKNANAAGSLNRNANNASTNRPLNSNRLPTNRNANANRSVNQNTNVKPAAVKPSPAKPRENR